MAYRAGKAYLYIEPVMPGIHHKIADQIERKVKITRDPGDDGSASASARARGGPGGKGGSGGSAVSEAKAEARAQEGVARAARMVNREADRAVARVPREVRQNKQLTDGLARMAAAQEVKNAAIRDAAKARRAEAQAITAQTDALKQQRRVAPASSQRVPTPLEHAQRRAGSRGGFSTALPRGAQTFQSRPFDIREVDPARMAALPRRYQRGTYWNWDIKEMTRQHQERRTAWAMANPIRLPGPGTQYRQAQASRRALHPPADMEAMRRAAGTFINDPVARARANPQQFQRALPLGARDRAFRSRGIIIDEDGRDRLDQRAGASSAGIRNIWGATFCAWWRRARAFRGHADASPRFERAHPRQRRVRRA